MRINGMGKKTRVDSDQLASDEASQSGSTMSLIEGSMVAQW